MRRKIPALVASAGLAIASPTVFSVHDDILAFPQFQVVFSESYISELDANLLLGRASPSSAEAATPAPNGLQHHDDPIPWQDEHGHPDSRGKETYETMWLYDQEYFCSIPTVEPSPKNETSEAEAIAEEKRELARATDRGWELLQGLGGGNCLYFISGWWSYSFCYNSGVTQFHPLTPQPGRSHYPPQRDPNYAQYVLGKVKAPSKGKEEKDDERGNDVELHRGPEPAGSPITELQIKGETRYLVQKLDGGTTCDLTGKPRRIEIQYHCSNHATDVIAWIKEVTTCSYVMVIYTPRLCNDVAFLPPKETIPNIIACRQIVPDDEISYWEQLQTIAAEIGTGGSTEAAPAPITIGGVVVGGGRYYGAPDGPSLPLPANWQGGAQHPAVDVIARSTGKTENNKVEVLSDAELQKLDLDPEVVEQLKSELQKMAGDHGWKLEMVEVPGEARELRGVVVSDDGDDDGEGEGEVEGKRQSEGAETKGDGDGDGNDDQGSGETYMEEI